MINIHQVNPLTYKLFNKNSIREIIREWQPYNFNEENIEMYERTFMSSLCWFINDGMYTARVLYQDILDGKELKENLKDFYSILYDKVKTKFMSDSVWIHKQLYSRDYETYKCVKTIEGKFYEGEIYKKFKIFKGMREGENGYIVGFNKEEKFNKDITGEEFTLTPQGSLVEMIIPDEYQNYFEKHGK